MFVQFVCWMKWWAAVTVVAIPSQKALLMCPYVSSGKFSVLAPRCSRAFLHNCSCDHQQGPACGWLQGYPCVPRVIGTRWWVHRVVDPARRRISRLYRRKPAPPTAPPELRGSFFCLARSIGTTNFSHPILVRRNRDLSRFSVFLSY